MEPIIDVIWNQEEFSMETFVSNSCNESISVYACCGNSGWEPPEGVTKY